MNTRLLRKVIGLILAALLLTSIVLLTGTTAAAQQRYQRRVIIVQPARPFRTLGFDRPYDPFWDQSRRFNRYRYYSQYFFSNSDKAEGQGYKDGFKTGRDDGKKVKSYDPQRSHYYYDAGFGNFGEIYRSGFSRGYRDGFREGQYQRAS
jgi:hypothetical protein